MLKIITVTIALTMVPLSVGAQDIGRIIGGNAALDSIDERNIQCVTGCLSSKNECLGNSLVAPRRREGLIRAPACFNEYIQCMRNCTTELGNALSGWKLK